MVFERYPAGGGEFTLALALADNAHDDGTRIFPSVATMAQKSRQDERSVQRHLKAMLASGWLVLVKAAGGRGRPAEYRINPGWLKGDNLSPIQDTVVDTGMGGTVSPIPASKRVTSEAQKGDKRSTPYKNPRNLTPPNPPPGGERVKISNDSGTPDVEAVGAGNPRCDGRPGTPGFEAVAAEYPRRDGMAAAAKAWRRLAPDLGLQLAIADAIRSWKRSDEWRRDRGRWVPSFGKFLRDQRWLDAPGAGAESVVTTPVSQAPDMTPEQLRRNAENARAAVAQLKGVRRQVAEGAAA